MKEILRSNDLVYLSWVEAVLRDAGLTPVLMDQHASAVEGGILAIQRRVMISDEDESQAQHVLRAAGAIET